MAYRLHKEPAAEENPEVFLFLSVSVLRGMRCSGGMRLCYFNHDYTSMRAAKCARRSNGNDRSLSSIPMELWVAAAGCAARKKIVVFDAAQQQHRLWWRGWLAAFVSLLFNTLDWLLVQLLMLDDANWSGFDESWKLENKFSIGKVYLKKAVYSCFGFVH